MSGGILPVISGDNQTEERGNFGSGGLQRTNSEGSRAEEGSGIPVQTVSRIWRRHRNNISA